MMRRVSVSTICLGVLLTMLGTAPAAFAATTLTVDTFEDSFDGSCADGDCSIRDAVAAVDPGGTVRLPAGFFGLNRMGAGPTQATSTSAVRSRSSASARPARSWTPPD
jgi:hypothetical protein